MKTGHWKTVLFTVAILAVAALLIVAGAKAAELSSFGRHHHEYHSAAFRLASAAQHLR
jgi:sensor domain CHASE-containing protein